MENNELPGDETSRRAGAQLFAETIAAHGGETFLAYKTLKLTGKGEFTTPPQTGGLTVPLSTFTYYVTADGRSRLEARLSGAPLRFIIRGHGRGGIVQLAGRTLALATDITDYREPTAFLCAVGQNHFPIVADADPVQSAEDATRLLQYTVYPASHRPVRVWIEAQTKQLRKLVQDTSRGEMTILLSAYQKVDELSVPTEWQLLENGASIVRLMASELVVDEPLNDKLFEQP